MTKTGSGLSPLALRQRASEVDLAEKHAGFVAGLQRAVSLLEQSRTLSDSTRARAMAQMAEDYARAERLGEQATQLATEIRIRAARKAGELLARMKDEQQRDPGGKGPRVESPSGTQLPTLADLGVTKKQSATWQAIARVPEEKFEDQVTAGWGENAIAEGERRPRSGPHHPTSSSKPLGNVKRSGLKPSVRLQKVLDQLTAMAQGLPNLDLRGEDCDDLLEQIALQALEVKKSARNLKTGGK